MASPFEDGPEVWPHVVSLARDLRLAPGASTVLAAPKAQIMNVGIRIQATGEINATLEELEGENWTAKDHMPCIEGDTIWHHQLQRPTFRLCLFNPSSDSEVSVTADINMPQRPE